MDSADLTVILAKTSKMVNLNLLKLKTKKPIPPAPMLRTYFKFMMAIFVITTGTDKSQIRIRVINLLL